MTDLIAPQLSYMNLTIPAWQMALYVAIVSLALLVNRRRLALIITYLFTLNWAFFLYFGDVLSAIATFPNLALVFLLCGLCQVILTVIAFLQGD